MYVTSIRISFGRFRLSRCPPDGARPRPDSDVAEED